VLLLLLAAVATRGRDGFSWTVCALSVAAALRSVSVRLRVELPGEVTVRNLFRSYRFAAGDVAQIERESLRLRWFGAGLGIRRNIVTITSAEHRRVRIAASQTLTGGVLGLVSRLLGDGARTRKAYDMLEEWRRLTT
jgi:hypothetical protein